VLERLDDDGDTRIDYPLDPGCQSAGGTLEIDCSTEVDPLILVTAPVTTGTTAGAGNNLRGTCSSTTATAPDRVHYLTLAVPVASLTVTTTPGFDAVTSFTDATCTTTANCQDSAPITVTNLAAGGYGIAIDGWSTGSGNYTLDIRGQLSPNGACNDPLVAAGVLACPVGFACGGPAGAETCEPAACNNATDEDGDGFPGYPNDPGCTSPSDGDEVDDCPSGPGCPVCSNDLDDDTDGQIDYPLDLGCVSAAGATEVACPAETDPVIPITAPATTGTTVGASNSLTPTCGSTSHTAPDRVHQLNLAVPVANLRVNLTATWDAATSLRDAQCGTTLVCSDPNSFTRANVAPGGYTIIVDGWGTGSGAYTLNVAGDLGRRRLQRSAGRGRRAGVPERLLVHGRGGHRDLPAGGVQRRDRRRRRHLPRLPGGSRLRVAVGQRRDRRLPERPRLPAVRRRARQRRRRPDRLADGRRVRRRLGQHRAGLPGRDRSAGGDHRARHRGHDGRRVEQPDPDLWLVEPHRARARAHPQPAGGGRDAERQPHRQLRRRDLADRHHLRHHAAVLGPELVHPDQRRGRRLRHLGGRLVHRQRHVHAERRG
jgi:hypothetical protein